MTNSHPAYENGQDIRDRTFEFACEVVALCETLFASGGVARMMVPQLLNCSTSAAAMLEEARAAESTRDFISKSSIGLKESRESHVRLRILLRRQMGPGARVRALTQEAGEIVAIVTTIVGNTKRNARERKLRAKAAGRRRQRIPNS
jgi:four helix bundle protein